MRTKIKRVFAILMLMCALSSVLFITSCGISGSIEDFLKADTYTLETDDLKIMVERASVYRKDSNKESYLYFSKEEGRYFYCEIKDGKIKKKSIDSEMYIVQREQMIREAASISEGLTAFLQLEDTIAEADGKYTFGNTTVYEIDGTVFVESQSKIAKIYGIDDTRVEIPESVKTQYATIA